MVKTKKLQNFKLNKWKNLKEYLNTNGEDIEEINESNVDDVLNKFYLINTAHHINDINCESKVNCFCGRDIKHYWYVMNVINGDMLIVGGFCKEIFYDNLDKSSILNKKTKIINTTFYNNFINSFSNGTFINIDDWNEFVEECIRQYMKDCDLIQYETLRKLYINNEYISKYLLDNKPKERIVESKEHIVEYNDVMTNHNINVSNCKYIDERKVVETRTREEIEESNMDIMKTYFNDKSNYNTRECNFNRNLIIDDIIRCNFNVYLLDSRRCYSNPDICNIFKKLNVNDKCFDVMRNTIKSIVHSVYDEYDIDFLKRLNLCSKYALDKCNCDDIWSYNKIKKYLHNDSNFKQSVDENYNEHLKLPVILSSDDCPNMIINSENNICDIDDIKRLEKRFDVDLSRVYKIKRSNGNHKCNHKYESPNVSIKDFFGKK